MKKIGNRDESKRGFIYININCLGGRCEWSVGRLDPDWRQQGWQYEAYSSLGSQWLMRGHGENPVLSAPAVKAASEAHGGVFGGKLELSL